VILYTAQGYDLRHFPGPIDKDRGTYHDHSEIATALKRLYGTIGSDQVVWALPEKDECYGVSYTYLHELDVDSRDIVRVLDTFAWNHCIGNRRFIPEELQRQFQRMAADDPGEVKGSLRSLEDDFLANHAPTDPWSSLFTTMSEDGDFQVLVAFPFKHSTVQRTWAMDWVSRKGKNRLTPIA
jgi:hypothetical protein